MTQSEKAKRMNELVGDEMIAHLQYTFAASKVIGPDNDACKAEFTEHAQEEYDHMLKLLDKMNEQHMPINADILALTKNAYSGYKSWMAYPHMTYFCFIIMPKLVRSRHISRSYVS